MTCSNCGSSNPDAARFCFNCAAEFGATIPSAPTANPVGIGNEQASALVAVDREEIVNVAPAIANEPVVAEAVAVVTARETDDDEVTRVGPAVSQHEGATVIASSTASDVSSSQSDKLKFIAQADSLIGRTIEGKYRIDGKLGAGGMGTVYRAMRPLIGDVVAVKVLHQEHVADQQAFERFRREAQAAARLKHPNAVSIHDFGVTSDGLVYLVMELVEGQSLRQIIKQQGPLTQSAAAEVINQVCAALDEAHRQQIVHRDLKPDNIIVSAMVTGLRVKVLDFGIAKLRDMAASNLTQTGSVMGTPHYMSPEQCLGEELDSRSDIYSLGIVLYEMLTGVVPFNSPMSTAVVVQHVNQTPPSLRTMNLSISPAVEAVVMHALAKKREDRPQTAAMLAQELSAAVNSGLGVATFPPAQEARPGSEYLPTGGQQPVMMPTMVMRTPTSGSGALSSSSTSPYQVASATFSSQPQATIARKKPVAMFAAIGVVCLIAILVGAYLMFFSFSAKKAILDEVKKGNLVKPQGNSAYDLFLKYKTGDLKQGDVDEIAREAVSALEKRGNEIFANVKKEPQIESEDDWAEAGRLYTWLNELRANRTYEARRYFSEGRIAFLKKDYDTAMAGLQRSLERDASSALTLNAIGRVFLAKKDKTSTREYYRRATVAEPGWIAPWVNLGELCYGMKDYAAAEAALRQAIQINYQKASPHNVLGQVLEEEGRLCEAVSEYQIALDTATNNPTPTVNVDTLRKRIAVINSKGLICGN